MPSETAVNSSRACLFNTELSLGGRDISVAFMPCPWSKMHAVLGTNKGQCVLLGLLADKGPTLVESGQELHRMGLPTIQYV